MLTPLHVELSNDIATPCEAAVEFVSLIKDHLEHHDALRRPKSSPALTTHPIHRDRAIVRLTKRLASLKNNSRKQFPSERSQFLNAVRAHNKTLRAERQQQREKSGFKQEKAFRNNPWKFANSVCNEPVKSSPTFSQTTCFQHFETAFSDSEALYKELPDWVPRVSPSPDETDDVYCPFDMSAITPGVVKRTLQKCSTSSSPGHDQLTYFHLRNLPCTHYFLATLFTKILLSEQEPPSSWFSAEIILIHKGGDPSQPGNFRPIALTSIIPKIFHKIIAKRLEHYLLSNNIFDPSLQKGFLSGVNGTVEHVFAISCILDNAINQGLPLAITFLDLKNAFGSIAHSLIRDMFDHMKLPSQITSYIMNGYSKLSAIVKTKKWSTPPFSIKRGVFQGDTLSPLIFLVAFNPLIQVCNTLSTCGFSLRLPIANSSGLPPVNSAIYVMWNETQSEEPSGWYYAVVCEYHSNGEATIEYADKSTERLNLNMAEWKHTRKGQKSYLPTTKNPPVFPLKRIRENSKEIKYCLSSPHTVKGFADDLSVFSSKISDHQSLLTELSSYCQDLDLTLRPDKCISVIFDGKKMNHNTTFSLFNGSTRNIAEVPTKILGKIMTGSNTLTKRALTAKLESKVISVMQRLDTRPIRGEFKVWVWKNYLAHSLRFMLMVDAVQESVLVKIQKKITKFIKRWLNLPRCCTLATIFHPDILNLPFLPQLREQAKMSMITSIELSKDKHISECLSLLSDPGFLSRNEIPKNALSVLNAAKLSVYETSQASSACLKSKVKQSVRHSQVAYWNDTLEQLQVQSKLKDIVILERASHAWNRMLMGLPSKQLSFLLRAGADCLPSPMNLRRWKYRVSSSCPLCSSPNATTAHILNGCPEALNQGRFTWRHDSVLKCLLSQTVSKIDDYTEIFADLPGKCASDSPPATIPADVSTTSSRPDVVVMSRTRSEITLLELTVPFNSLEALAAARSRKSLKSSYLQLKLDLENSGWSVSYSTLEIGSLGHYEPRAIKTLSDIFDLSKKEAKHTLCGLSRTAATCSYHIFNGRHCTSWDTNKPLCSL